MNIQHAEPQLAPAEMKSENAHYSSGMPQHYDMFAEMQQKIFDLENEVSRQKSAAEKGASLLKLMWGYSFEADSLH